MSPDPVPKDGLSPMPEDPRFDRRTFVKGCVAAGVAGAGIAGGLAATRPLGLLRPEPRPAPGEGPRTVPYLGAKKVDGPADRALPLLPLAIGDGVMNGRPTLVGRNVLDWYRYCGHEETPALQAGSEPTSDALTYRRHGRSDPWYGDHVGERVRAEHFDDPPQGASVTWRSQDAREDHVITAEVLRLDPENVTVEDAARQRVARAGLRRGFLAFVTFCPYRCCVPGWRHAPEQAQAQDAWAHLFCTCCYSEFDPFTIAPDTFELKPG